MEDKTNRIIRYLNDAWAVEKALVDSLKDMGEEANDPAVRALLLEHSQVTHQQEESLEARIRQLGGETQTYKGYLNQFIAKAGDFMNMGHDQYDRTTQNLMQCFATENFELAMYESLAAFADAVGDAETAQLARQIQQQERETAEKLWPLIAPVGAKAVEVTQI
jgi:ferritin-like metal-binding protein YciE